MTDEFGAVLQRMRADADPRLSMTLAAAFDAGWSYSALGRLLGVSRQAVEQRVIGADFYPDSALPAIPAPPRKPGPPPKVPKKRLTVKPELADHLRELHEVAKTVNGVTPVDAPARRASEELSETLYALIEQGVTAYHLSQVLRCTQGGISQRLARHGFPTSPGYARQAYPYKNTTTWPRGPVSTSPETGPPNRRCDDCTRGCLPGPVCPAATAEENYPCEGAEYGVCGGPPHVEDCPSFGRLPCGHTQDRIENDEVAADEHERLCESTKDEERTEGSAS